MTRQRRSASTQRSHQTAGCSDELVCRQSDVAPSDGVRKQGSRCKSLTPSLLDPLAARAFLPLPRVMTCPFGYGSSLAQTKALDQKLQERDEAKDGQPATVAAAATAEAAEASSDVSPLPPPALSNGGSVSPGVISLPLVNRPAKSRLPLSLWTGGLRTSLGVENVHPIS